MRDLNERLTRLFATDKTYCLAEFANNLIQHPVYPLDLAKYSLTDTRTGTDSACGVFCLEVYRDMFHCFMGFPFANRGHVAFKRMRLWLEALNSSNDRKNSDSADLVDGILFVDPLASRRKVERFMGRHCGGA